MTLPIKDLDAHREKLVELIEAANEFGFVKMHNTDFVKNITRAQRGHLTPTDLEDFNMQIREYVLIDVYPPKLAAAWAGVGFDAIRTALWKQGTLRYWKPAHDAIIFHEDLKEWVESYT